MATRRNSSDVMQRILDAATEVFANQGLAGARMDEIAARAGVSKALIYYHIPDKESLYASVMS
ncbi:MAG: TetR/AcrR family transcriptional regulator, partial [Thioalkalivibrio sp.]|nr:TetR/AcrR family transcriptional regulator [Thioalkalivibrio sp.]